MRFDVAALRAAAEQAQKTHREQWEKRRDEAAADDAAELGRWVDRWGTAWQEASRVIARKARAGKPITIDDLPCDRYRDPATWSPPHRTTEYREYAAWPEMAALLAVLPTIADTTVTSAGLRDLGVTASTLRACVVHMAKSTVKG
jgi:hypothetical protein